MIKTRNWLEYQLDVAIRIDLFDNNNIGDNTNVSIIFKIDIIAQGYYTQLKYYTFAGNFLLD